MSTQDAPQVIWIPADKVQVQYTLHDVLSSAVDEVIRKIPDPTSTSDPTLAGLLQKLKDLSTQLKDVIGQVNQSDPTILGGKGQG